MWTKIDNKYYIIDDKGELIPAKKKEAKYYGILWETEDGKWIKKIHAKRNNIKLTGNKKKMHIDSSFIFVPV